MKNDFIDIRCEGDAEQFARTATKLIQDKTPSTMTKSSFQFVKRSLNAMFFEDLGLRYFIL